MYGLYSLFLLLILFLILILIVILIYPVMLNYEIQSYNQKWLKQYKDQPEWLEQRIKKENYLSPLNKIEINNRTKFKYALIKNFIFYNSFDVSLLDFARDNDGYILVEFKDTNDNDLKIGRKPYEKYTNEILEEIINYKEIETEGEFIRKKAIWILRDYDTKKRLEVNSTEELPLTNYVDLYEINHYMNTKKINKL